MSGLPAEGNLGRDRRPLGARGEATRRRLMDAAEEVFGTRGYHAASVTDITQKAGVAQGTFYLYFDSKLELFQALVREISTALRRATTEAIRNAADRRDAEQRGFRAFFEYLRGHRHVYKVVREAEFVDEALFRWYYQRIAEGYVWRLNDARERGQLRADLDTETLAWSMMGVAHMLGLRYVLWEQEPVDLDRVVDEAMKFLAGGFKPGQPG
jgi:AcrR family transcriptional regulator